MTAIELKRLIAEYTNVVWNEGNVEAMDGYYQAEYVHHDVCRPDVHTLADYKQWARDLRSGLQGMRVVAEDLIADAEGNTAVKRWTATGAHNGSLAGIAPTGKQVRFSGVSIYRMSGGKVAESWYSYDLFGLLQQLGALPGAGK
jgi:steroid delta-isomerase-like uncharacterized protein